MVLVDAYTQGQDQAANPAKYAISDGTHPACDLTKATIGSLGCSPATLIAGDTSKYQFADGVHPTPFGYKLFADYVAAQRVKAGWL